MTKPHSIDEFTSPRTAPVPLRRGSSNSAHRVMVLETLLRCHVLHGLTMVSVTGRMMLSIGKDARITWTMIEVLASNGRTRLEFAIGQTKLETFQITHSAMQHRSAEVTSGRMKLLRCKNRLTPWRQPTTRSKVHT